MNARKPTFIRILIAAALCGSGLVLAGCASTRNETSTSSKSVDLRGNNFKVVKAGAVGTSYGFRLLGIFPFASPHYATAQRQLWDSLNEPKSGRSLALTDEKQDRSTAYFILFSLPKITLTADIVEFSESGSTR